VFEVVSGAGQAFLGGSFLADDIVGSQGIVGSVFLSIASDPHQAADNCVPDQTKPFFGNRRVTGRNTPSAVGAVYLRNNFWDGRANHQFNGVDPFGATANPGGHIGLVMENASLASQAVGPPNNPVEISCANRTFNGPNSLEAKLLARQPLQFQLVAPTDSVLGPLSASPANGLTVGIFTGKGECSKCHAGAMLSDATVAFAAAKGLVNEDGGDQGFHNLGVRPTAEDLGRAGTGPNGASWAENTSIFNRGAFKTPGLRNVKLTAPYFHNGGKATLAALVDFLTNALTDCRTEKEQAPFDHPSLPLPNGTDLPAVGAIGTGTCS
jgi:cytochrome c peroxidase